MSGWNEETSDIVIKIIELLAYEKVEISPSAQFYNKVGDFVQSKMDWLHAKYVSERELDIRA